MLGITGIMWSWTSVNRRAGKESKKKSNKRNQRKNKRKRPLQEDGTIQDLEVLEEGIPRISYVLTLTVTVSCVFRTDLVADYFQESSVFFRNI